MSQYPSIILCSIGSIFLAISIIMFSIKEEDKKKQTNNSILGWVFLAISLVFIGIGYLMSEQYRGHKLRWKHGQRMSHEQKWGRDAVDMGRSQVPEFNPTYR